MLLHRVFAYLPSAPAGRPGHPGYVHTPQGKGRLDNPDQYVCCYLSAEASGAVGEVFGDLIRWSDRMFTVPFLPGSRRALGTYSVPDDTPILDLDDAKALLDRRLRPTQVIARNRPVTQAWALGVYNERSPGGQRLWSGVRWWSYQRPHWRVFGLWDTRPDCVDVAPLGLAHPAVIDAARALAKPTRAL